MPSGKPSAGLLSNILIVPSVSALSLRRPQADRRSSPRCRFGELEVVDLPQAGRAERAEAPKLEDEIRLFVSWGRVELRRQCEEMLRDIHRVSGASNVVGNSPECFDPIHQECNGVAFAHKSGRTGEVCHEQPVEMSALFLDVAKIMGLDCASELAILGHRVFGDIKHANSERAGLIGQVKYVGNVESEPALLVDLTSDTLLRCEKPIPAHLNSKFWQHGAGFVGYTSGDGRRTSVA